MIPKGPALHVDQAPPLAVPGAFFLAAPLAVVAAGVLLVGEGSGALVSRWTPTTIALVHLGTLGLLATTMLGALYQMAPVVAGAPVPAPRLSHGVLVALLAGVAALASGLTLGSSAALHAAVLLLGLALAAFLGPVGWALLRAPVRSETVRGMRVAVLALLGVASLGVWMAFGHGIGRPPLPRDPWVHAHLALGLFGWVGGLITAVSWHVVPMFYFGRPVPPARARVVRWLLVLGLVLPLGALALGKTAAWTAAPAAFAVWALHPALTLHSLSGRPARRTDGSLGYWAMAMGVAPLVLVLSAASLWVSDPRLPLLVGWLAVWGWAGAVVHGMLTRIVPFLVWFHRFSPLAGKVPIPAMRQLLPDRWTRTGLLLHAASLAVGVGAIASGSDALARATGVLVASSGVELFAAVGYVLWQRPAADPAREAVPA